MTGFLPETPGVIKVEGIAEIRRLYFVEKVTVSELAKRFKLSRPTIRKPLKTVGDPIYSARQHQPHPKLGDYLDRLNAWLDVDAALPKKRLHTARRHQAFAYFGGVPKRLV